MTNALNTAAHLTEYLTRAPHLQPSGTTEHVNAHLFVDSECGRDGCYLPRYHECRCIPTA